MSIIFGHLGQDLVTRNEDYTLKNKANIGITNTGTTNAFFGFHPIPPGANYELPGLELREKIGIKFQDQEGAKNELLIVFKTVPDWYVKELTFNPHKAC